MLPGLHLRMASEQRGPEPTRQLEPPGFLALNYARCGVREIQAKIALSIDHEHSLAAVASAASGLLSRKGRRVRRGLSHKTEPSTLRFINRLFRFLT